MIRAFLTPVNTLGLRCMIPSFLKQKSAFYCTNADWLSLVEAFAAIDVPESVKNPAQLVLWLVENRQNLLATSEVQALRDEIDRLQSLSEKYEADNHIMGHRLLEAETKVEQLTTTIRELKISHKQALRQLEKHPEKDRPSEPRKFLFNLFDW